MKWLFLIFLPTVALTQQNGPLFEFDIPQVLIDEGYFVNRIDPIENRIDTLLSKSIYKLTPNMESSTIDEDNLLIFSELDNLLIIENSHFSKSFYFLEFTFEEGVCNSTQKNYLAKSGENIVIEYSISGEGIRKIQFVKVYNHKSIDYLIFYLK